MPPCYDVHVLVRTDEPASVLARFVADEVAPEQPREPRWAAFVRTWVDGVPAPGDEAVLEELRADLGVLALCLHGRRHHEAFVTITAEGDLVLGVGLDDPLGDPAVAVRAAEVMTGLVTRLEPYGALGGVAGGELPPPRSLAEWADDEGVSRRVGARWPAG